MARNKLLLLLVPMASAVGCANLPLGITLPGGYNVPIQEIETIQQEEKIGKTVYIQGEVKQQAPFLSRGAYKLQDQTGAIWITTEQNLPTVGQEIVIKGQVNYQSIPIDEQDWGEVYIEELRQLGNPK